jgi:hypothetical protein
MSKFLFGLAAAGLLFVAVPASAQDIGVSIGERGVRVGVDNDRRDYRRTRVYNDDRRSRRVYTEGRGSRGCSEVTVRKRLPNGNVLVRKTQRC